MTLRVKNVAEQSGWIKLHRKILDNPIVMKDSEYFQVWVYLLLKASHAEYPVLFGGNKINLKPGQLITGRKKISADTGIDENKVFRILKCLKNEQQIEQQVSNKNSLISIVRWEEYQNCEQQNEQQVNSKRTASEQQVNTNKNIKNNKNVKKIENNTKAYSSDSSLNQAILDFIAFRQSIKKPMTDKAVSLMLNKLGMLSASVPEQIEILNQSIINGWQGIFPLKGSENNAGKNQHGRFSDTASAGHGTYL